MIVALFNELASTNSGISVLSSLGYSGRLGCAFRPTTILDPTCWLYRFLHKEVDQSEYLLTGARRTLGHLGLDSVAIDQTIEALRYGGAIVSVHDSDAALQSRQRLAMVMESCGAQLFEEPSQRSANHSAATDLEIAVLGRLAPIAEFLASSEYRCEDWSRESVRHLAA